MQTYWFKSTLARPQKVGTFQILGKVWRQLPVIALKSTLARPQRVQILGSVTSMTLIGESVARPLYRTSCIQRGFFLTG
jgi:hypothetical protein